MTGGPERPLRVALTGATGFVGGEIARQLRSAGHSLNLLVRNPRRLSAGPADRLVPGGLDSEAAIRELLRDADVVVHCAGLTRAARDADFMQVNAVGTRRMAELTVERGVIPFLLISSLAAREPQVSGYARSKLAGELALQATPELHWAALRPPAVYGPGADEIQAMLRWMGRGLAFAPGAADARFSVIHVADLAAAVLTWLARPELSGVFDIHDQRAGGYSWQEFSEIAGKVVQRPVRLIRPSAALMNVLAWLGLQSARLFGGSPALTPDKLCQLRHADWVCRDQRFSEQTDWAPQIMLAEGLRMMWSER